MRKSKITSKFIKKFAKSEIVQTSPEVQKEMTEIANILTPENGFSTAFEDVVIKAASEDQSSPPFSNVKDAIDYLHKAQLIELEKSRVGDKLRLEAEKAKKLPKSEIINI